MNTADDFGSKLRQLRKDYNLTQQKLCKELELKGHEIFNKSTISRWENGTLKPNIEIVKDLEDMFGVDSGSLLRAVGYLVEIRPDQSVSSQIDPIIVKQRAEHLAEIASVAKSLLANGLENISYPGWSTNRLLLGKYLIPNENSASGYDEITKEELTNRLKNNMAAILKDREWFFRNCFIPHLKSELPEELKTKLFHKIIEEHPYQLIEVLRRIAYG